ncbi:MAG: hypothetical protein ABWZ27_00980 [Aestuariivirgaceae bacterium]
MILLDALQKLPLSQMFLATLGIGLAICLGIFLLSRLFVGISVRLHGIEPELPLALRESIISAVSAMFALLLAFSAAGIWNDRLQAANTVEREAEALENVRVLAGGLPADLAARLRDGIGRYATQVVDHDWPAMAAKIPSGDPVYEASDAMLVDLMDLLAREQARISGLAVTAPLLGQLVEARAARLARVAYANSGVSPAQWFAMILLASGTLVAIAVCHTHHKWMQLLGMLLYSLAAVAAFFVILAHDRPFVGVISVSPAPLAQLAKQ